MSGFSLCQFGHGLGWASSRGNPRQDADAVKRGNNIAANLTDTCVVLPGRLVLSARLTLVIDAPQVNSYTTHIGCKKPERRDQSFFSQALAQRTLSFSIAQKVINVAISVEPHGFRDDSVFDYCYF